MRYTLAMASIMGLFWLLNSGHYTGLLLGMGMFSVVFVTWIAHRMDVVDHESLPLRLFTRMPRYFTWLTWQIFLSNLDVVRRVWRRDGGLDPEVRQLPLPQQTDMGRVIYANSINLTPGTLTIDLGDDTLLVHALSSEGMRELENGEMSGRVSEVER